MDGANDLRITNFIAHVIDHRTGVLELSDLETPVVQGFPHDFFQRYIRHALASTLQRRACFVDPSGLVRQAVQALLKGQRTFVDISQEIAEHLHRVMRESAYRKRIKPGDIMIARVTGLDGESGEERSDLAILKIDPSDAVIREVKGKPGSRQVVFEKREDRVPEVEENKIQKIALAYGTRRTAPEEHDLVLLDNDIKQPEVAQFFYKDFLASTLNRSPREVTQSLLDGVKRFASRKPDLVRPVLAGLERVALVERAAARLVKGEPVTVEEIAEEAAQLPGRSAADVETIRTALAEDLRNRPEESIPVGEALTLDAGVAARGSKTRVFLLDGGVQIRGDVERVHDVLQDIEGPDAGGEYTLTLRTRTLEIR